MSPARTMKLITGIAEAVLAIPILGGTIVIGTSYSALVVMLVLHIITLVLASQARGPIAGSVTGIVTSCLAWIPFLGWALHVAAAIMLLFETARSYPGSRAVR